MRETADVVIVGAGVTGCSVAWHLASLGIRNILLLEMLPSAGQGSTSKANGGIRAQWSTAINIRLSLYSIEAYERFVEDTGGNCGLLQAGYLFMTASEGNHERRHRRSSSIEHGYFLDEEAAACMQQAGAYFMPTLTTYFLISAYGAAEQIPQNMLDKINKAKERGLDSLKVARAAGLKIVG